MIVSPEQLQHKKNTRYEIMVAVIFGIFAILIGVALFPTMNDSLKQPQPSGYLCNGVGDNCHVDWNGILMIVVVAGIVCAIFVAMPKFFFGVKTIG